MNKLYTYAVVTAIIILFQSCSDFLDQDVRGQENLETFFQDEASAEKYINGCYNALMFHEWWQAEKFILLSDMCTDDMWMGNTTQSQSDYISLAHYMGVGQSNAAISDFWQYRYKAILRCNIGIQRIQDIPMQNIDKKERLVAEAKFLRALFYFDLVKNFGGVPIMEGLMTPDQVEGVKRATADEVYALIERDFKDVAEILPHKKEYSDADLGRATRGAALGFLGKVYMYQGKFEEARKVLAKVIDENDYKLMDDFGKVWNVNYENNDESLFEVQNAYDESYNLGGGLSIVSGNRSGGDMDGWAWGLPTANLESAFIEAGDTERLKWTIIKNGASEIAGEDSFPELVSRQGNQNGNGTYCVDPSKHKSPRINRKFYIPLMSRPSRFEVNKTPLNYILLRYADILLLYAEACKETGDESNALTYLNMVRSRAGLQPLTLSGEKLMDAIRKERRLELALEGQRLYDIRRWTDINGKKMICNLFGPDGSFVKWNMDQMTADPDEWNNQYESSDKGITFVEARDMVFPIPLYEITMSNGSIEQNPGWN